MPFSRAEEFPHNLYITSQLARALAHPARIIILQYLCERRRCKFNELDALIILARPTILQHVRILRNCDLIKAHQVKGQVYYELNSTRCFTDFKLLLEFTSAFAKGLQNDQNGSR
jgi:ArsR family transcriptional regulator